ncbi:hypothetical protein L288_17170 [Sphingobium quisquiliarum P25]|uniref:Transposase n=1 Tax=Sphingobium quisquiliarum P25 TaxID=1329909 RepID=T0GMP0_9SPHN|nr:hypothetical protein L288_17170 [Sphingobium quisquiliarum P25]
MLYNRWKRWSEKGVLIAMMDSCLTEGAERKTIMIDATYFKAHRAASSLTVKTGDPRFERHLMLESRRSLPPLGMAEMSHDRPAVGDQVKSFDGHYRNDRSC